MCVSWFDSGGPLDHHSPNFHNQPARRILCDTQRSQFTHSAPPPGRRQRLILLYVSRLTSHPSLSHILTSSWCIRRRLQPAPLSPPTNPRAPRRVTRARGNELPRAVQAWAGPARGNEGGPDLHGHVEVSQCCMYAEASGACTGTVARKRSRVRTRSRRDNRQDPSHVHPSIVRFTRLRPHLCAC